MSERTPSASAADRQPAWRLGVLAALAVPLAGAGLPLAVYLPPFYAQELGLGLALVGAIFMLSRIWDAVSDPVIGLLSDQTRGRFGRRKPWIAAGAPLFALSTLAIFVPGAFGVKPGAVWLSAWLAVFYLGWTMIQIPLSAWAGELSSRYHERSRVQTYLQVATSLGLLAVLVLPAAIDQIAAGDGKVADQGLKVAVMGGFILATLVPALGGVLWLAPEPPAPPPSPVKGKAGWRQLIGALGNRLLLRVLASDIAVRAGQTIRSSLFVFFVAIYMGRPDWAALLFLVQFIFGVFAGPIWLRIGYRLGKHRTAVVGELVQVAINLSLLLVTPDALPLLIGLTIAQGLAQGSGNLMLRSIVSDVADKHRLETGEERTGLYFSIFSLADKTATALAVGIALPLVAWLGFQPGAANTPDALFGLKLVFALGPAITHALSALLIAGFPLGADRHAEIRAALDARDRGEVPAAAE